MRRLIAHAAGRTVDEAIRNSTGGEIDALVRKAATGDIGISEAATRALSFIRP